MQVCFDFADCDQKPSFLFCPVCNHIQTWRERKRERGCNIFDRLIAVFESKVKPASFVFVYLCIIRSCQIYQSNFNCVWFFLPVCTCIQ